MFSGRILVFSLKVSSAGRERVNGKSYGELCRKSYGKLHRNHNFQVKAFNQVL